MTTVALLLATAAITTLLVGMLVLMRNEAYRKRLWFDPKSNCVSGLHETEVEPLNVVVKGGRVCLPVSATLPQSAVLELDVSTSILGHIADPWIELKAGDLRDAQYFERGAKGTRLVNISRLLVSGIRGSRQIDIKGRRISCREGLARLHVCNERPLPDDRFLIVAPHPDDAEIAAYGLYCDTASTIVTLTAGDASDWFSRIERPVSRFSRNLVARVRVWNSLTIPQLGGLSRESVINLCFPDGQLRNLHMNRSRQIDGEEIIDRASLRKLNSCPALRENTTYNWDTLVADLEQVISKAKPTIVVTPHPKLDPHPDHLFTTLAVSHALKRAAVDLRRMYFYLVHNSRSELWPFGPAGSGVTFPPVMPEDGYNASGFYFHPLSEQRQREKFIALEAMHDLRDLPWPNDPQHNIWRRLSREARGFAHGMGTAPTSYLRRAVRPDELFLVTSFEKGAELAEQASGQARTRIDQVAENSAV